MWFHSQIWFYILQGSLRMQTKEAYVFNKEDLYLLIWLHLLVFRLPICFFTSLMLSHTVKLKSVIITLYQSYPCLLFASQSASVSCPGLCSATWHWSLIDRFSKWCLVLLNDLSLLNCQLATLQLFAYCIYELKKMCSLTKPNLWIQPFQSLLQASGV